MSEIIDSQEFDRIFDRIVYPEKLHLDMFYLSQAQRNFYVEKFLRENTYKVYFDNQLFYVMTDAFVNMTEEPV
jgi:hypothetical protein